MKEDKEKEEEKSKKETKSKKQQALQHHQCQVIVTVIQEHFKKQAQK